MKKIDLKQAFNIIPKENAQKMILSNPNKTINSKTIKKQ